MAAESCKQLTAAGGPTSLIHAAHRHCCTPKQLILPYLSACSRWAAPVRPIGLSDARLCAQSGNLGAELTAHLFSPAILTGRPVQVVSPRVRAFLYTWGGGRTTAEGEHIPFRMDPIELQHADHISLVLPLTLEHEIDERSPLYGHTYDSLTVCSRLPVRASLTSFLEQF